MADRLHQVLTFTTVAPFAQSTLPYRIAVLGVPVLPDLIYVDQPGVSIVGPVTTSDITIQNNTLVGVTVNVWLFRLHSIERAFGDNAIQNLSPQPVIIYSNGGTGGASTNLQAFRYTATGAEGTDFFVSLPTPRATDNYRVTITPSGTNWIVAPQAPDIAAGDRTTTQFRVMLSADLQAGDTLDIIVIDAT